MSELLWEKGRNWYLWENAVSTIINVGATTVLKVLLLAKNLELSPNLVFRLTSWSYRKVFFSQSWPPGSSWTYGTPQDRVKLPSYMRSSASYLTPPPKTLRLMVWSCISPKTFVILRRLLINITRAFYLYVIKHLFGSLVYSLGWWNHWSSYISIDSWWCRNLSRITRYRLMFILDN